MLTIKITIIWNVTLCSLVEEYRCFGRKLMFPFYPQDGGSTSL
jgi:hypothetical protein